jgi:hypothetical protein
VDWPQADLRPKERTATTTSRRLGQFRRGVGVGGMGTLGITVQVYEVARPGTATSQFGQRRRWMSEPFPPYSAAQSPLSTPEERRHIAHGQYPERLLSAGRSDCCGPRTPRRSSCSELVVAQSWLDTRVTLQAPHPA